MIGGFQSIHPAISFFYFIGILFFSMVFKNPLYLVSLLVVIISMNYLLDKGKKLKKSIKAYLFMALIILIMNPIFSSRGATILGYFRNRPVTLESIVFGGVFATSLLIILISFVAYNIVITADRFLYLTGSIIPKTAFIITVTMRFIPLFQRRLKEIMAVQKSQGKLLFKSPKKQQLREGMETLNTLVTWSLEESLQTAASMRSRGYGIGKRTSAKNYKVDNRDWIILLYMIIFFTISLVGFFLGYGSYNIYPKVEMLSFNSLDMIHYISFCLFIITPIFIDGREMIKWHIIKSKI